MRRRWERHCGVAGGVVDGRVFCDAFFFSLFVSLSVLKARFGFLGRAHGQVSIPTATHGKQAGCLHTTLSR